MDVPAPSAPTAPKPCVLLVDDEAALLEVLRLSLSGEFDVEIASNSEDAELLMETGGHDVIVCDHLMPGESGLDFLVRASRRHPTAKRILSTGYMNPEFLDRSTRVAGLSACLVKPVQVEDLRRAIRAALAGAA